MASNLPHEQIEIVSKYQRDLPVNLNAIAIELGLKIYEVSNWPDNLSGKIVKDPQKGGSSGYAIFINGTHSTERKRFTLAHEIAHYLLHKNEIGDGIVDDALYRSGLSNHLETMANRMAAFILMPEDAVINKLKEGFDTIEKLAVLFKVSTSAMAIRLGVPASD